MSPLRSRSRGARVRGWLGRRWLRLTGWTLDGESPTSPKLVVIAAPHDTNWDLPYTLAASWAFGLDLSWMGKKSLFRWPFGGFMRWLGGVPVDRSAPQGVVEAVVERFRQSERFLLAIPPEGTRGQVRTWRSGFHRIAVAAQVPILCGFIDYRRRVVGLGGQFEPTGDVPTDMAHIRRFYREVAQVPAERVAEMRLREELPSGERT